MGRAEWSGVELSGGELHGRSSREEKRREDKRRQEKRREEKRKDIGKGGSPIYICIFIYTDQGLDPDYRKIIVNIIELILKNIHMIYEAREKYLYIYIIDK